jgi:hypothetical protein
MMTEYPKLNYEGRLPSLKQAVKFRAAPVDPEGRQLLQPLQCQAQGLIKPICEHTKKPASGADRMRASLL